MSDKQEANVIFALHFDDVEDPRYLAITELLMAADMWRDGNLVVAKACDSKNELIEFMKESENAD